MSDFPIQTLLQQSFAKSIDGEHLELLGKKAAASWADGVYETLNEAVVETVKHASLSPEQVRRVIEFTNTSAFLGEFNKEGSSNKFVDFGSGGPADPSFIIKDLNDGGGGNVFDTGTFDYDSPPETKQGSTLGSFDNSSEKTASIHGVIEESERIGSNPLRPAFELREKLASLYETSTAKLSTLENLYQDLSERLFHHVKQASMNGHSLGEIVEIWGGISPDDIFVKVAFDKILPRLIRDEVMYPEDLVGSLQKTASTYGKVVNSAHPLVSDFKDFCDVLDKLASTREEQLEYGEGLSQLNDFLMKMADADSKGLIQKAFDGVKWVGDHADRAGQAVGGLLLGDKHKRNVGTLARYATYAVPAVAAHEFYRKNIKHNPMLDKALSVVPGTQQYNNKEMEIMMQNQPMMGMGMGY